MTRNKKPSEMVTAQVHLPVSPLQKRLFDQVSESIIAEKGGWFRGRRMAKRDVLEVLCRRYLKYGQRSTDEIQADIVTTKAEIDSLNNIMNPIRDRLEVLGERLASLENEYEKAKEREESNENDGGIEDEDRT